MVGRRADMHRIQDVVRLSRLGESARRIGQLLGMGRNTVRRYLAAVESAGLLQGNADELPELSALKDAIAAVTSIRSLPAQQTSTLESWREQITAMWRLGAGATAIFDRLRTEEQDFRGSVSAMKRFCARLALGRGVAPEDVAIPVETPPGEIAQLDFGYLGKVFDPESGTRRKLWVFVMTLAFSRHIFADLVFDQTVATWLVVHDRAFRALGGVPKVLVPDNLKAAVVRAAFSPSQDVALNKSYRELARHFGFKIDPTPPFSPEKKGKVEASVKYVQRNFFVPRADLDKKALEQALPVWLREVAGQRLHGTTRKRPLEVFEHEEKAALLPLPSKPFDPTLWKPARVHSDAHVLFGKRLYSVPWTYLNREVWIRATPTTVSVYCDDQRIAAHSRLGSGARSTVDAHLPDFRNELRHQTRTYWEERALRLGEPVARYVAAIFDSDDVLSKLRTVQAIVRHLDAFPKSRAHAACERALHFGNLTYQGLKSILSEALDFEPLPAPDRRAQAPIEFPRFARSPTEILLSKRKEAE